MQRGKLKRSGARRGALRCVCSAYDYVYEVNPWGDKLITAPEEVTGTWRARLPHRIAANFAQQITLLAYEVQPHNAPPALTLTLYWQALTAIDRDYTVFVHLLAADGTRVAQGDSPPQGGHYPTTRWQVGEIIRDAHTVQTENIRHGVQFAIGLYDLKTMARLSIVDEAGRDIGQEVMIGVGNEE